MNDGWVKLWRGMVNWEWYTDHVVFAAFIHCIISASHKHKKYRGIEIKPGMFMTGISKFGSECGLSDKQVRRAWGCLEKTGEIITKRGKMGTVITVCKYEDYQATNDNEGKIRAQRGQDKGKIRATIKNDKKLKNEINNPYGDSFLPVWDKWKLYKKEEHNFKYASELSEQAALDKLYKLTKNQSQAERIVEQSIENGWKGFFKVKSVKKNSHVF